MKKQSKAKRERAPAPVVREPEPVWATKDISKRARSGTVRKQGPGPQIVRAWFDTVLNPLLDGLRVEHTYVKEKNWTWRWRNDAFEAVRPVEAHVGWAMRDNLMQFVQMERDVQPRVTEHEEALLELAGACRELQSLLSASKLLRKKYRNATSKDSLQKLDVTLDEMFGGYPDEDRLGLMAQYIINRTPPLPDYYSACRLWNVWREEFLEILDAEEIRPHTVRMDAAGERLLNAIVQLMDVLEEARLRLSLQHDVPYRLPSQEGRQRPDWEIP